ncbi:unnamed protein product [Peronospora belbahrii]|uniref:Uncharacterized protein n=1 Tax=Peronospora belbahrii TaxID=622444 RepID=A0AAU9KR22_9STRA|nr:unnamed protein product [Peronospora belbahrii]CAH0514461.1 unnamed protein product [Peronospora belbahrii]
MPLLLRPSAPSPSIDELAFVVTAAPLSSQSLHRSVSSTGVSDLPRCTTHSRLSLRSRQRGSTIGTDTEFAGYDNDSSNDLEHFPLTRRHSHRSLRHMRGLTITSKDIDFRDSKRSSHDTLPDDDHISSNGSFASEAGRASSLMSCSCSCADANDLAITSSSVVIEDQQLAVVDKELRDFRKTLVRKLYSRLTKLSDFGRRKSTIAKPVV